MVNIKSIEAGKYNIYLAEALKKEDIFKKPEWADYVKSSAAKMRPINEADFWNKRAASILRQIYIREIVGVERLKTRYGGKKNRGQKPSRFVKGGGKIIRTIVQQAEEAGFVEKSAGKIKGRKLTSKGKEFLENVTENKSNGGKDNVNFS